jgi:uncharacterized membrane protein YfcA
VSGFGIGSVLIPVVSVIAGAKLAVALVSVPHFFATLLRFWLLRRNVDKQVLRSFGISSAAGGLMGAVLHTVTASPLVALIFGSLLVFAGISGLAGWSERMRFGPRFGWLAGVVSGLLGGLAGNQGGIRSAALLGFELDKAAFVATSTATGLIVDVVRMPVYLYAERYAFPAHWQLLALMTAGTLFGTVTGAGVLRHVPQRLFRKIVAALLLVLGAYMLVR